MAMDLDARNARWLECPLYPEEVDAHRRLARDISTPLAVGESYRSLREMTPFIDIAQILQPDLGRCGLSGSMEIAAGFAGETIPHLSIAMGPQIAAALHFAAATDRCTLCEYNPNVLDTANQFLARPLHRKDGHYVIPDAPGLGIEWNDRFASLW
jgi:D-galactarolactone cycloisomerase